MSQTFIFYTFFLLLGKVEEYFNKGLYNFSRIALWSSVLGQFATDLKLGSSTYFSCSIHFWYSQSARS